MLRRIAVLKPAVFVAVGALAAAILPAIPAHASTPAYQVDLVSSVLDPGAVSFDVAHQPLVSADGRFVAYDVEEVLNWGSYTEPQVSYDEVVVADRASGETAVASHADQAPDVRADNTSTLLGMSADGRYVAFKSNATNIVSEPAPIYGAYPYVADMITGAVTQVPLPVAPGNWLSSGNLSADGSRLAVMVASYSGAAPRVLVVDWRTGAFQEVPGLTTADNLSEPTLSGDGHTVAFINGNGGVRVYDFATNSYRFSADDGRGPLSLSADGDVLAYEGSDWSHVNVVNFADGNRVEVHYGVSANAPAISPDGSTLAFSADTGDSSYGLYSFALAGRSGTWWNTGSVRVAGNNSYGFNEASLTQDGRGIAFITNGYSGSCCNSGYEIRFAYAPDDMAPVWATDSAVSAHDVTGSSLVLQWPAATDNLDVTGYAVSDGGRLIANVLTATSYQVTGLEPGSHHSFTVQARDLAGNMADLPALDVTTPLPSSAGTAPLAATAAPGGTATLRWDADSSADSYRILRALGDGSFAELPDVVTTTTWTDSGLLADTHYRYVVESVTAGAATPYTVEAGVDTPPITITSFQLSPDKIDGNAIPGGGSVGVRLEGEANRTASVVMHWTGAGDVTVPLTENTTGAYGGTTTVPTGATELASATATLTDGVAEHAITADAAGLPLATSGVLSVTVADPGAGSLVGATLTASSRSTFGHAQTTLSGPGTVNLTLAPATDYELSLALPGGAVIASVDGLSVTSAATTETSLQPVWPYADLTVHLLAPTGQAAGGFTVSVGNGYNYYQEVDLAAGQTDATFTGLATGGTYTIKATLDDPTRPLTQSVSSLITVGEGANEATVQETALPTATISGVVTAAGEPYAGMGIEFAEHVDGRSWTFTATSGPDGRYSAQVLAGSVTVRTPQVPFGYNPAGATVEAAADQTTTVDLALGTYEGQHAVSLRLYTQDFGSPETLQTLDWRTNYHFHVTLTDAEGQPQPIASDMLLTTDSASLTFCADGREAGMSKGCVTVPLDSYQATLALHLSQSGAVTGSLLAADGSPLAGRWSVSATPVDSLGRQIAAAVTTAGDGAAMHFGVPTPGLYRILISSDAGSYLTTKNVPDQTSVDLGTIQLVSRTPFVGSGTSVVASPSSVLPGQLVDVRTAFEAATTMDGAVLRLAFPLGATLVPDGVTLNGQPAAGTMVDGFYEVPLGDLVTGDTGVVRYTLQVADDAAAGALSAAVRVRYNGLLDDPVGTGTTQVVGVTLFAPTHANTTTFAVRGQAIPGAQVSVTESGSVVATAIAGPGGLWGATVDLGDPFSGTAHTLTASITSNGKVLTSHPVQVIYDRSWLMPSTITVSQPSGRAHSFDPSSGVATFTLVYAPSEPIRVQAAFPDTSRLLHPTAWVGGHSSAMTCGATLCTADVNVTPSTAGDVWVDYDVAAVPYASPDDVPVPTAAQLEQMSHTAYGTITDVAVSGNTVTGNLGDQPFSLSFNDLGVMAADALPAGMQPMTGPIPGYVVGNIDADAGVADVTVAIPKSWLDLSGLSLQSAMTSALAQPSLSLSASALSLQPALEPQAYLEVAELIYRSRGSRPNLPTTSASDKLAALDTEIAGCACPPEQKENMRAIVQDTAVFASFTDLTSKSTNFVANFLPGALGLFFGTGVTGYEDHLVADALADTVAEIHHDIAACTSTPPPGWPPMKPPAARPTWIFDPSGYTYEAVASNRLPGVTATIETAPSADGPWTEWNAADFGQDNPQITDAQGRYGWDVPIGWYRVRFDKAGYATAYSQVVHVLPEWTDLNVGLARLTPASATGIEITADQITVSFDTWMDVDSVLANTRVEGPGKSPVPGTWTPVDPQKAPDGTPLATRFAFKPERGYHGNEVDVTVFAAAKDYAGVALGNDLVREFPLHGGRP